MSADGGRFRRRRRGGPGAGEILYFGRELIEGKPVGVALADVAKDFLAVGVEQHEGGVVNDLAVKLVTAGDAKVRRPAGIGIAVDHRQISRVAAQVRRPFDDLGGTVRLEEELLDLGQLLCANGVVPRETYAVRALGLQQEMNGGELPVRRRELKVGNGRRWMFLIRQESDGVAVRIADEGGCGTRRTDRGLPVEQIRGHGPFGERPARPRSREGS